MNIFIIAFTCIFIPELCYFWQALKQQFLNPAKKIHWRFIKEVERPRLVQARVASIFEKDNLYAQVTVRLHTEQVWILRILWSDFIWNEDQYFVVKCVNHFDSRKFKVNFWDSNQKCKSINLGIVKKLIEYSFTKCRWKYHLLLLVSIYWFSKVNR